MKCFVIAMPFEAQPVISAMTITCDRELHGRRVVTGILFGQEAAVVVCGVGKVNAACGAQYAIDILNADAVINLGVAGGLKPDLEIAGTYSVSAAVQYDVDLRQPNGTKIGTLDEYTENYLALALAPGYTPKKVATGDRFNDDKADFLLLTGELDADIRDMELGAVAQVCRHAGVKCYGFKTISDLAGSGSTTEQYKKNIEKCRLAMADEIKNIMGAIG